MRCETCQSIHDGHYGSGRFCNARCARKFSTLKNRDEISQKVAATLKHQKPARYFEFQCQECRKIARCPWNKRRTRKYCSTACCRKGVGKDPDHRKKMSCLVQKRLADGTFKFVPWKTRRNPSYAEQRVIEFLSTLDVTYDFDRWVGRYCIDFAFEKSKTAIEIDGKQHLEPARKQKDAEKDVYLKQQGWTVYRLTWSTAGKTDWALIQSRIIEILQGNGEIAPSFDGIEA